MRAAVAMIATALLAAAPALARDATPAERAKTFAKLPNWNGYWLTENDETSIGGLGERTVLAKTTGQTQPRAVMSLYGAGAPWNDEGKKRQTLRGKYGGLKAQGWGYPIMMNAAAPIQFIITPEEVASAITYLCSDAAASINGAAVPITGGEI